VIDEQQKKDLTMKQRKWLDIYLETGNATEAAMQSYDCQDRNSASQIGYENLRKLDYIDFMEAAGVTDQLLQKKLIEGLSATKQIGARKVVQGARAGHEIKVDASTDTDDFIDVEDYYIRHK
jgi:phage terminase small subunit